MKSNLPKLAIILPCYNEEEILPHTSLQIINYLKDIIKNNIVHTDSKICFVDDGSKDTTWHILQSIIQDENTVIGIKLARNAGHQSAILAGLQSLRNMFDCYITIDVDLQDDIRTITQMVDKYTQGCKVVYGVREDRSKDTWFKRFSAELFYKIMLAMKLPIIFNHADFRLIDNVVLNHLNSFQEVNLFLRGIIPLIGFKTDKVYYKRLERELGETKYPLRKMISFAWNGITSFSTLPMRLVLYWGFAHVFICLLVGIYAFVSYLLGHNLAGWTSTLLLIAFFSGSNMIAIGLIGEYIGKIYQEVKSRPLYIIEEITEIKK